MRGPAPGWHVGACALPALQRDALAAAMATSVRPGLVLERVAVEPSPETLARPGLNDREVYRDRQARQGRTIREAATLEQTGDTDAKECPLAMVERFLGTAELARPAPANLDDNEPRRRARVRRKDVQLTPAETQVPAENLPAERHQPLADQCFCRVAQYLPFRSRHARSGGR